MSQFSPYVMALWLAQGEAWEWNCRKDSPSCQKRLISTAEPYKFPIITATPDVGQHDCQSRQPVQEFPICSTILDGTIALIALQ